MSEKKKMKYFDNNKWKVKITLLYEDCVTIGYSNRVSTSKFEYDTETEARAAAQKYADELDRVVESTSLTPYHLKNLAIQERLVLAYIIKVKAPKAPAVKRVLDPTTMKINGAVAIDLDDDEEYDD